MPTKITTQPIIKGGGRPDRYRANGKVIPSVTTILGRFKDPGALMYWSWKTANDVLEEALDLLPSASPSKYTAFLRSDPRKRANFREKSADACTSGNIAHDLVESWIHSPSQAVKESIERTKVAQLQQSYKTDQAVAKAAHTAFQAFISWSKVHHFTLLYTEIPLVSEYYKFGGTIDCIGELTSIIEGEEVRQLVLLDWKTSGGLYTDYLCQLGAYGLLWEEKFYCTSCFKSAEEYHTYEWVANGEDDVYEGDYNCIECLGKGTTKPIDAFHLLRFDKQTADFTHKSFSELNDARGMFLKMRECYEIDKQLKKRIK